MEILVLASASPRRSELLSAVGLPFEAVSVNADERCDLPVAQAVSLLAQRKVLAGAAQFPGRTVLAADTLVALEGQVLGKPKDEEDALRMLRLLSGRTHEVFTGVAVAARGAVFSAVDCSRVTFDVVPSQELSAYVASGEPLDKAGAYGIQGRAALWISHLEGSYSSVMGLPLHLVRALLLRAGFPLC